MWWYQALARKDMIVSAATANDKFLHQVRYWKLNNFNTHAILTIFDRFLE